MSIRRIILVPLLAVFGAKACTAAVHNVPGDHSTIQAAIDAAMDGDEIVLAPGIYVEKIDFGGKAVVVRSTDPLDAGVVAATIIDGNRAGSVVTCANGEGPGAVLSGLTITNGSGTLVSGVYFGGGVYCDGTSPTIEHCVIAGNGELRQPALDLYRGGGIYCLNASPTVRHNRICDNEAGDYGGGVCCEGQSSPLIEGNLISGNKAASWYNRTNGGGIACRDESAPTIRDNSMEGNNAQDGGGIACADSSAPIIEGNTINGSRYKYGGGGIHCAGGSAAIIRSNAITGGTSSFMASGGGGIYCSETDEVTIQNNVIAGNHADRGGGIHCHESSPLVVGNIIHNNTAGAGGGLSCYACDPPLINNTICDNTASVRGGGVFCYGYSAPPVRNCILAFNAPTGIACDDSGHEPAVSFCDIHGNTEGPYLGFVPGPANVSEAPAFADRAGGDYHLTQASPCIDRGDDAAVDPSWVDVDGQRRMQSRHVDIGADETESWVAFSVTGVQPTRGGNSGFITLAVSGTDFRPGAEAKLAAPAAMDVVPVRVEVESFNRLTARFDLTGVQPGTYHVVVKNWDGETATLPAAFEVFAGGEPRLWVNATLPGAFRDQRVVAISVTCGNVGTVDLRRALIDISVTNATLDAPCSAGYEERPEPFTEDELIFVVLGLPPGSVRSFPVYVKPTSAFAGEIEVTVRGMEADCVEFDDAAAAVGGERHAPDMWSDAPMSDGPSPWTSHSIGSASDPPPPRGSLVFNSGFTGHAGVVVQGPDGQVWVADNQVATGTRLTPWQAYVEQYIPPNGDPRAQLAYVPADLTSSQLAALEEWVLENTVPFGITHPYNVPFYKCTEFVLDAFAAAGRPLPVGSAWDYLLTPAELHWVLTGELAPGLWPNILFLYRALLFPHLVAQWSSEMAYLRVIVFSKDPNEKVGPGGFGDLRYIAQQDSLAYAVHFENDPEKATAAAAEVRITDHLDPDLDWSTFRLTGIQVAGVTLDVAPDTNRFGATVPAVVKLKDISDPSYPNVPPEDTNVNIDVDCRFNASTGLLFVEFRGRDPGTGAVMDFLPPNVFEDDPGTAWDDIVAPHGEGLVSYTCAPKAGLSTGTHIENVASIVFDMNDPMDTNTVLNTIDSRAPQSAVDELPPVSEETFTVTWSGTDVESDTGAEGSGVAAYAIYVSDNGGPFTKWLPATQDISAEYHGETEHEYRFYSVARDGAGNVEAPPAGPDAQTAVSIAGALVTFQPDQWERDWADKAGDSTSGKSEDKRPKGKLTCFVRMVDDDVRDIVPASLVLNETVPVEIKPNGKPHTNVTVDEDTGERVLTAKFNKFEVAASVPDIYTATEADITVGGEMADGTSFQGIGHVTILGEPRTAHVASAAAQQTRNGGAQITFVLTRDCDVAAYVMNIAGRTVATVTKSFEGTKGTNTLLWNGLSDRGLRVPNGLYIVRIGARSKDGQQSQAITTLPMRR